jgi:hypothetical protein
MPGLAELPQIGCYKTFGQEWPGVDSQKRFFSAHGR